MFHLPLITARYSLVKREQGKSGTGGRVCVVISVFRLPSDTDDHHGAKWKQPRLEDGGEPGALSSVAEAELAGNAGHPKCFTCVSTERPNVNYRAARVLRS